MAFRLRALFALFAVSGFCGLIYESIWSHYLKLFLGHAAYAQTVVLIVFIGGLALGSWLAGHYALRVQRPLLAYAAAEFLVGLAALFFHGVFVASTNWAYDALLPATCSSEHWCWSQWLFAGLLILPQSILLGTTFPLMSTGLLRLDPSLPGGKISLLYFLNSFGAVVGVLCSGYLLIPNVGLPGALFTAGSFNLLLAIGVYFVDKNTNPTRTVSLPPTIATGPGVSGPIVLLSIALLTGLSSFIYEIVWVRSLSLVLGSTTHSFELMLASFILGLALGGLWIRKRIDRITDTIRFLAIVQVVMGVLAIATLPVYNGTFDIMAWILGAVRRSDAGWILFNLSSALISLLVMLPATFMAGMTLPLITYTLLRSPMGEKSIGHVYAANTVGGILGVIIAVHLGLPLLGLKGALILGGAIDIALGIFLLMRSPSGGRISRISWSGGGIAAIAAAMIFFHFDPLRLVSGVYRFGRVSLPSSEVVFHRDGKTATVDVFEYKPLGILSIATNGKSDGAASLHPMERGPVPDEYTMVLTGALPLFHSPQAKTAAIIGFGTGMTTATLLTSPTLERVDTIEIEPAMVEGAGHFRYVNQLAFEDRRSHIIIDDAKSYFARSGRRYDVIVSEPSNPWVSGVSSLFTREFYKRIRSQLNDDGILVQWVHLYAFSEPVLASVIRALGESFPHFVIYTTNNIDIVLVASASSSPLTLKADAFQTPAVVSALGRLEITRVEDLALRQIADTRLITTMLPLEQAPANSDYFPILDTSAGRLSFLDVTATQLTQVSTAPWPIVDMINGEPRIAHYPISPVKWRATSDRVREAQRAEAARAYLTGEKTRDEARGDLDNYERSLSFFHGRFIACQTAVPPGDIRDAMIETAGLISVYLSTEAADKVWDRAVHSPCYAKLDKDSRDWIALFRAVARRDNASIAETAHAMLVADSARPLGEFEYLYGAAMTALISSQQTAEARRLFQTYGNRLPEARKSLGWFRWMASAARN